MNAYINNNQGKTRINKLSVDEMNVIQFGFQKHEEMLQTFYETLKKSEFYKDYSICHLLRYTIHRKLSSRNIPKNFSLSFELHELFIFYDVLRTLENEGNPYHKSIASQLIMLVHPLLPATEKTRTTTQQSKLNA